MTALIIVLSVYPFKVRLLVSDIGAKSHIHNIFKFNGYYGCHYCTVPGKTIGKTHSYYPSDQCGDVREQSVNNNFIKLTEVFEADTLYNVVGVKGRSAFSSIIDGLPLTAPIDYMHCVLLGVFPDLLRLCFKELSTEEKIKVNIVVSNMCCPREMVAFSRKIRSLDDMPQFKANEHFNWFFYISPIVFMNRLPSFLFSHLSKLVFGIRLLLESSCEATTRISEKLLNEFCEEIVSVHMGNEKIEIINVHCPRHFADQVRRFGPLCCYSAMSFEAANRLLSQHFSGSHSEAEIICRRFLQRQKLAQKEVFNPKLKTLFDKFVGCSNVADECYDNEFRETEAVKEGRKQYPDGKFFNRVTIKNVYFDCEAYRRSRLGNCYVYFFDENEEKFGQIEFFVKFPNCPFPDKLLASVRSFDVVEKIGLFKGVFYSVSEGTNKKLVPVTSLRKVFPFKVFSIRKPHQLNRSFMVKLCSISEHS